VLLVAAAAAVVRGILEMEAFKVMPHIAVQAAVMVHQQAEHTAVCFPL
jgi:hypothetical protein